jgi:hypothetical protein
MCRWIKDESSHRLRELTLRSSSLCDEGLQQLLHEARQGEGGCPKLQVGRDAQTRNIFMGCAVCGVPMQDLRADCVESVVRRTVW